MSPYGYDTISVGKCSICGGIVVLPRVYWSVVAPVPRCSKCGAIEDVAKRLPTIPMKPAKHLGKLKRNVLCL